MRASVVIDANIIAGLMAESCHSRHQLSGSPTELIDLIKHSGIAVCLDSGNIIRAEWAGCTQTEWFENWYVTFVTAANVIEIPGSNCVEVIKHLQGRCNFPRSRDCTVVRLSVAAAGEFGDCAIATEDLDFYEPIEKRNGSRRRAKYMDGSLVGSVKRYLRKQAVHVQSVYLFDCDP